MKDSSKDSIYAKPMHSVPDFVFDSAVVSVFDDMIQRSVPGYSTVIAMTGLLAERFARPDTSLYDLGCSLGASGFAMAARAEKSCQLIAVDNSPEMLAGIAEQIDSRKPEIPIQTQLCDIESCAIENASVVALNYTLQFVAPEKREELLQKINTGMLAGGVLVLSEKILFEDPAVNELYIDLHHEFKRANGYSDLEISQKREAIEDVLRAETISAHRQRLESAGFRRIEVWFQCLNFASLIAFK